MEFIIFDIAHPPIGYTIRRLFVREDNETGVEDVRFACASNGMPLARDDEIVDRARSCTQLGDLRSTSVRPLLASIRTHLGFSIVANMDPDEVWSAGNTTFSQKGQDHTSGLTSRTKVLVAAAHSDYIIRIFCIGAFWMKNSKFAGNSNLETVWKAFLRAGPRAPDRS